MTYQLPPDVTKAAGNAHLRESSSFYAQSAYAPEKNPWVKRDEMDAALLFRGAIISSYGHIETRLAEMAIRCSRMDAYVGLKADFPYSMPKRLAFLRSCFAIGPLARYGNVANAFFTRFEDAAELRHMMAHAYMETGSNLVGLGVVFHDYQASKSGIIARQRRMTLPEFEQEAAEAARFSQLGRELYWRLSETGILPPLR